MIDPTIFKAYDVRGTYPDQINEEAAYAIGAAFIAHFGVPSVAVGRDMRLSSPAL
ncbi:MAG TPA: phosphomannomutase/phosphoglucomutase, partial [Chloroflexota bacterium]|nr:phosphomannomutase/phosphoglucomutase [Chloroflexota bacterium]